MWMVLFITSEQVVSHTETSYCTISMCRHNPDVIEQNSIEHKTAGIWGRLFFQMQFLLSRIAVS